MKVKYLLFAALTALVLTGCKGKGGSEQPKDPTLEEIIEKYDAALDKVVTYQGTYTFSSKFEQHIGDIYDFTYGLKSSLDYETGRGYCASDEDEGRYTYTEKYMPNEDGKTAKLYSKEHSSGSDYEGFRTEGLNAAKGGLPRAAGLTYVKTDYVPSDYMYMMDNPTLFAKLIFCMMLGDIPDCITVDDVKPSLSMTKEGHIDFGMVGQVTMVVEHVDYLMSLDIDINIDIKDEYVTDLVSNIDGNLKAGENELALKQINEFHFATTFDEEGYTAIEAPEEDYSEPEVHSLYIVFHGAETHFGDYSVEQLISLEDVENVLEDRNFYTMCTDVGVYLDPEFTVPFTGMDEALIGGNCLYISGNVVSNLCLVTYQTDTYSLPDCGVVLDAEEIQYLKDKGNILFYKNTYITIEVDALGAYFPTYRRVSYYNETELFVDGQKTMNREFESVNNNHAVYNLEYYYGTYGDNYATAMNFEVLGFKQDGCAAVNISNLYGSSTYAYYKIDANQLPKGKELTATAWHTDNMCAEEYPVTFDNEITDVEVEISLDDHIPVTAIPEDYNGIVYIGVLHTNYNYLGEFAYLVIG